MSFVQTNIIAGICLCVIGCAGLRLTTNIVGCAPEDVRIDMPVKVCFEAWDEVYLPLFEPASPGSDDPQRDARADAEAAHR